MYIDQKLALFDYDGTIVDSAGMIVQGAIEAFRMFDFDFDKYRILIHPESYVHAIVKFNNGLIKFLIHDTDMKIPIFNSLYISCCICIVFVLLSGV